MADSMIAHQRQPSNVPFTQIRTTFTEFPRFLMLGSAQSDLKWVQFDLAWFTSHWLTTLILQGLNQIQWPTKVKFFTPWYLWLSNQMTKLIMMMRYKQGSCTRKWVLQTGSKRSRRRDIWMTVGEYWYYHLQVSIYPLYKHSLWNFLGLEKKSHLCWYSLKRISEHKLALCCKNIISQYISNYLLF